MFISKYGDKVPRLFQFIRRRFPCVYVSLCSSANVSLFNDYEILLNPLNSLPILIGDFLERLHLYSSTLYPTCKKPGSGFALFC